MRTPTPRSRLTIIIGAAAALLIATSGLSFAQEQAPTFDDVPDPVLAFTHMGEWITDAPTDLAMIDDAANTLVVSVNWVRDLPGGTKATYIDPIMQLTDLKLIVDLADLYWWEQGEDITQRVQDEIAAIESLAAAYPGRVVGVKIADELNYGESRSLEDMITYINMTAGPIKARWPELTVLVDSTSWEQTLPYPGERDRDWWETTGINPLQIDSTLDAFLNTGLIDGFLSDTELLSFDPTVTRSYWQSFRNRWPGAILIARGGFGPWLEQYGWDAALTADRLLYAPYESGWQGSHIFAWSFQNLSIIDQDGTSNPWWDAVVAFSEASLSDGPRPSSPVVDGVSSGSTGGGGLTVAHTTSGLGRLMLVGVSINNDNFETVSSVTYDNRALSFVGSETQSDDARVEIWQLIDPPLGTHDVVISFNTGLRRTAAAGVITLSGVDQINPMGPFAGTNATSGSAGLPVASAPGELVLGVFSCETCGSVSFSSPGAEAWNVIAGGGEEIGAGATIEGRSPQVTINANLGNSDHWALGGISIRPGASGDPPTNEPPVAVDDGFGVDEDGVLGVAAPGVLGNDSDGDGDGLVAGVVTGVSQGVLVLDADGSFTYTPGPNFHGTDGFVYEAADGNGGTDQATVTITVAAVNDPPVAVADSASTLVDSPVVIPVLDNDSDVEGDSLTVTNLGGASNGTVEVTAGGVTYTPAAGFSGTDSFTYTAHDGSLDSNETTVTVTVTGGGNEPPVAVDDGFGVDEDGVLGVAAPGVLGNDSDGDGDGLVAGVVTGVSQGVLVLDADGSFTYTPGPNFHGTDGFVYEAADGNGGTDQATVTITVAAVNDPPVAVADSASTLVDSPVVIPVLDNDSDVEGDSLTVTNLGGASNGTVEVTAGGVTYTPAAGFSGTDSFTYTAHDGSLDSNETTVTVTVTGGGNEPPVTVEVRVGSGSDDAEERDSGRVSVSSSDLEMVFDRSGNQTVGIRFGSVGIPAGSTIVDSYIQFQVDETSSGETNLTIRAQAADNAPGFTSASGSISARPVTNASVGWSPVPWPSKGAAGPDQRTPSLNGVVQEVIGRPGWVADNALVVIISGSGERVAESFDGDQGGAPLLHVEYLPPGPGANRVLSVDAGPDQSLTLPNSAVLDGTVSDNGSNPPGTVTTTWEKISGPGTVIFGDPAAVDTTAMFSVAGTYVLRLTATDSVLTAFDDLTVTVSDAGGQPPVTVEVRVASGSDDAEERASGSMRLRSSDLEMVSDGGGNQTVGMRFVSLNIPSGSTILDAYVQFQVDETPSNQTSLTIWAQAADNAPTFSTSSNNISTRPRTDASVAWSPAPWPTVGAAGPDQQTPPLATLIQEVINRPGWTPNNALVLIISGSGERVAESFNGDPSAAPLLHIQYQPPT